MGRHRFLLDTNLALLLVVGLVDRTTLDQRKHKRVAQYDARDFDILWDLLGASSAVVFTPNVLTEVSNLLRQGAKAHVEELMRMLAKIIGEAEERLVGSNVVAPRDDFLRLGLADAITLETAVPDLTILTDDLPLYLTAQRADLQAINFAHLQRQHRPEY